MTFLAYLFTVLKNVIYGSSVFFTDTLTHNVDVLDILAIRFLLSFSVLYLLKSLKIVKINVGLKDVIGKTDRSVYIKSLLLAAIFEPVLYMLFETLGISMTTQITAGVILALAPVSSCICESILRYGGKIFICPLSLPKAVLCRIIQPGTAFISL